MASGEGSLPTSYIVTRWMRRWSVTIPPTCAAAWDVAGHARAWDDEGGVGRRMDRIGEMAAPQRAASRRSCTQCYKSRPLAKASAAASAAHLHDAALGVVLDGDQHAVAVRGRLLLLVLIAALVLLLLVLWRVGVGRRGARPCVRTEVLAYWLAQGSPPASRAGPVSPSPQPRVTVPVPPTTTTTTASHPRPCPRPPRGSACSPRRCGSPARPACAAGGSARSCEWVAEAAEQDVRGAAVSRQNGRRRMRSSGAGADW
jgi:hypothetical protein